MFRHHRHISTWSAPEHTGSARVWYRQCRYGGGFCDGFCCPGYTASEHGGYCSCNALADVVDDLTDKIDELRGVVEQMTKYRMDGER